MFALLLILISPSLAQDCADDEDCDGDGYSFDQGDCDDDNPAVNPEAEESCANQIDDNCDRLFNEGCDHSAQQGQLWGGGACRGGEDNTVNLPVDAALILLPFLWGRRERG